MGELVDQRLPIERVPGGEVDEEHGRECASPVCPFDQVDGERLHREADPVERDRGAEHVLGIGVLGIRQGPILAWEPLQDEREDGGESARPDLGSCFQDLDRCAAEVAECGEHPPRCILGRLENRRLDDLAGGLAQLVQRQDQVR